MTVNEIRTELIVKTELKIQEMKARSLVLPERRADLCELCDMLSQEIYDYAVKTTIQIADRNHLRKPIPALLDELQEDIYALTNGALDIVVAASSSNNAGTGSAIAVPRAGRKHSAPRFVMQRPNSFQLFFSRLRTLWGFKPAAADSFVL